MLTHFNGRFKIQRNFIPPPSRRIPTTSSGRRKFVLFIFITILLLFRLGTRLLPFSLYSTRWFGLRERTESLVCVGVKLGRGKETPHPVCIIGPFLVAPRTKRPTTTAAKGLRKTKGEIYLVSFVFFCGGDLIWVKAGRQYSPGFEIFLFNIWLEFDVTFVTKGIDLRTIQLKESRIC